MRGHNTCERRGGQIRTWDRQGVRDSYKSRRIRLAMMNIRLGREGGLEAALHSMKQGDVDVGVLQETKLADVIHAQHGSGYAVWASEEEIRHNGGITVVWWEDARWQVEGIVNFIPNMASFLTILGSRRWYVVGAYVPLNNGSYVHRVK